MDSRLSLGVNSDSMLYGVPRVLSVLKNIPEVAPEVNQRGNLSEC